ncbi:hypothetical protein BLA18110_00314 [Burkholderia lata]|uniref:ATP-binding protein n=1 Tax=Burkholderia lata (strain ATCC 17760 / DSM 23089 / LMG 22485 / NCIMB 9086 / R18194 / 383) TaxID=482957 RepID=UPI0014531DAC|nr:ATP-binding protein [Burkholderia lata]VWC56087.1 hypothetical protein BLA18110_00314 [Burkholderia lata]
MLTTEELSALLERDESPVLEFKRDWYWSESDADLGPKWGEFLKDLIALCNGYDGFVGEDRYLIVGYCEELRKTFNVDVASIKALQDLREFKKRVTTRLEQLIFPPLLKLEIATIECDGNQLLVFRIPSPTAITELRAELSTKTRTLDAGAVLVRKGQSSDSIRLASPQEIDHLKAGFDRYSATRITTSDSSIPEKERSVANTVQLYIEQNASFSIDVGYPKIHRDRSENIAFELFRVSEALGAVRYFLYVPKESAQQKTYGYLKSNKLLDAAHPPIVLTEKPAQIDGERRKENFRTAFKTEHVFFIEEFGRNFLYGDYIQPFENYNQQIFVESRTTEEIDGDNAALSILSNWYRSIAIPVMVIKGYGGIGKTTLVKQFLDTVHHIDKDVGLLFIDSNDIIDRLLKSARAKKKIDDLYDFYLAQNDPAEISNKNFSKELLKLSVDNGSLLIVLDGIDEVIAKLGSNFDISGFIASIVNHYCNNLERGKVILTCRDNFWLDINKSDAIREITLKPFNTELAKEFFKKSFEENDAKVGRAMEMADRFALKKVSTNGGEAVYIPYVLDLIAYLIKHKTEFGEESVSLTNPTAMLRPSSISSDFLIGSVCEREIKKLDNYSVDEQINFLIDFSASPHGYVSLYDVKRLFEDSTSYKVSENFVEKLVSHPLLSYSEKRLSFRYDFFYEYFKALYIYRYLVEADVMKLNSNVVEILGTYVGFDNEFSRSVCKRIELTDDLMLFAVETIDNLKIRLETANPVEAGRLRSAVSGVFTLLLSMYRERSQSLDIAACTDLLKQLFLVNDCINGAFIVGLTASDRARPVFDFRGETVRNSHFEGYECFWDCLIDDQTRFQDCVFVSLDPRKGVRPRIFSHTFDKSCDTSDITDLINRRSEEISEAMDEMRSQLQNFFKLFYKQGNFYPKKQDDVRARLFTGQLLSTLLKNKVIVDYQDPKKATLKQYKVAEQYRPIIKLFEQGGTCLEFERVVALFSK